MIHFHDYFTPLDACPLPPFPSTNTRIFPAGMSITDQLLREIALQSYWIHDMASGELFAGNSRLLSFYWHTRLRRLNYRLMALDFAWQIHCTPQQIAVNGLDSCHAYASGSTPYSQEAIEGFADKHPAMHLVGDGERDWLLYKGCNNSAQSYILANTWAYLLFFTKHDDGQFYKRWELYGGMELSGGIVSNGLIRANEGFGMGDSTPFKINAATGELINPDPCLNLTLHLYTNEALDGHSNSTLSD